MDTYDVCEAAEEAPVEVPALEPVLEPVAGVDTEEAPGEVELPVVAGAELPTETLEEPPVKQESLAAR